MKKAVTLEFQSKHPPERVWRALTTREAIEKWLMPNDFEPKPGHRFTFRRAPIPQLNFDGIAHCEVLVLEPPRRLEFSFKGGPLDTVVRFRLEPNDAGTRIYFEHAGFDLEDPRQLFSYETMGGGWKSLGERLEQAVEELP